MTSQWFDLVGLFATSSKFRIRHQFIAMELYPCLYQTQLLSRQIPGKDLAVTDTYGRLELGVSGMNMR